MGKRSRARAQATTDPDQAKAPLGRARPARASAGSGKAAPDARARLDPVRRTLAAYVGAALAIAILTLLGIVVLGGTLGPFITLAVVVVAAGLTFRAASGRLAGATLRDEDRVMQTMAGGMLVLCVVLAAAGAVVATLA